jgi:acyl-CoA reductase-like NAD-dependent aldehyde dehydrogenase
LKSPPFRVGGHRPDPVRTAAAAALEAGYVWINGSSRHFTGVPFGGVKLSGIGREESLGELLSYTQLKTVNVMLGWLRRKGR